MRRWVAVSFRLQRVVQHPRIVRKPILNHGGRFFHVAHVEAADDLEDDLRALLTEAYLDAG
jgi:hypothetical protein